VHGDALGVVVLAEVGEQVVLVDVSGSSGTAAAKQRALEAAGVAVGRTPSETARLVRERLT
jgi:succinyl-CoA synthetase alpha subunit